jgi:hypothetical protein
LVRLCAEAEADAADLRERALATIWAIFEERKAEFLSLRELVETMLEDDSGGWDTAVKGRPITSGALAKWFRKFGLESRQKRQPGSNKHPRGFERADLVPVVARYLPNICQQEAPGGKRRDSATDPASADNQDELALLQSQDGPGCRAVAPSQPRHQGDRGDPPPQPSRPKQWPLIIDVLPGETETQAEDRWYAAEAARRTAAADRAEAERLNRLGRTEEAKAFKESAAEAEQRPAP